MLSPLRLLGVTMEDPGREVDFAEALEELQTALDRAKTLHEELLAFLLETALARGEVRPAPETKAPEMLLEERIERARIAPFDKRQPCPEGDAPSTRKDLTTARSGSESEVAAATVLGQAALLFSKIDIRSFGCVPSSK